MSDTASSSPALEGLSQQGYYELSTDELRRLSPGLRFTPTLMLLTTAVGLALRRPEVHAALAAIGLLGFILPRHHPIDLLHNLVFRHLTGTSILPANPLPRRLATLVAAGLNLGIYLALIADRTVWGCGLGIVLLLQLGLLATRHLCLVSMPLEALAIARNRPAELLTGDQARRLIAEGALLIDVRSPKEFANGHAPGAVNLPIDGFERHVSRLLAEDRDMVLYCAAGVRCNKAAVMLEEAGSTRVHQLGTLARWSDPA